MTGVSDNLGFIGVDDELIIGSNESCDAILQEIGLSQVQVSALLGITPQAISKACKEKGGAFLLDEVRINRLYELMVYIGGDRYTDTAKKLHDFALRKGIFVNSYIGAKKLHPKDVYESKGDLWIVSDNPENVIDHDSFNAALFPNIETHNNEKNFFPGHYKKTFNFFCSSISGADKWAYILDKMSYEAVSSGQKFCANVRIFITNLTKYSDEFVLATPSAFNDNTPESMNELYKFIHGSYYGFQVNNFSLVKDIYRSGVRIGSLELTNWQGLGDQIDKKDIPYLDDLIGVRGKTHSEDESSFGEGMCGGIISELVSPREIEENYGKNTLKFNKKTKFTPVFILGYKRSVGDTYSKSNEHNLKGLKVKDDSIKTLTSSISNF